MNGYSRMFMSFENDRDLGRGRSFSFADFENQLGKSYEKETKLK